MRQLKFRAWHKPTLRMYSSFAITKEGHLIQIDAEYTYHNIAAVDVCVMQFTGMKDSKGTEIYEGDIVSIDDSMVQTFECDPQGTIEMFHGAWKFGPNSKNLLYYISDIHGFLRGEVIGNIHQNPELIKP